ncbi:helix-turn-helix domain-containing protein [Achromobacter xylosoxidans]
MTIESTLPDNLRKLRGERGLSQIDLAMAAGVASAQISRYEQGRSTPRSEILAKIAQALGTTPEELTGAQPQGRPRSTHDRSADLENQIVELRAALVSISQRADEQARQAAKRERALANVVLALGRYVTVTSDLERQMLDALLGIAKHVESIPQPTSLAEAVRDLISPPNDDGSESK